MTLLERLHGDRVHPRRARVLSEQLAALIPRGAQVLDVGCGDGLIGRFISERRPDVGIRGLDVRVRPQAHIPVELFDGRSLERGPERPDIVMFVDVLHHTEDPLALLCEGARAATQAVLIKDHTLDGLLAGPTLRFLDRVGNQRHGVATPYRYWSKEQWMEACETLGLSITAWLSNLKLYPWPADWLFGRSLHFVARCEPAPRDQRVEICHAR